MMAMPTIDNVANRLYKPKQTADILQVSPSTVVKLLRTGELSYARYGKRVYVHGDSLAAYIHEHQHLRSDPPQPKPQRPQAQHRQSQGAERAQRIQGLRDSGMTLQQIGTEEHISRERVRQILARYKRINPRRLLTYTEVAYRLARSRYLVGKLVEAGELRAIGETQPRIPSDDVDAYIDRLICREVRRVNPGPKPPPRGISTRLHRALWRDQFNGGTVPKDRAVDYARTQRMTDQELLDIRGFGVGLLHELRQHYPYTPPTGE